MGLDGGTEGLTAFRRGLVDSRVPKCEGPGEPQDLWMNLRRFSNPRGVLSGVPGGVFLRKTPLRVRGSALYQLENRYSSRDLGHPPGSVYDNGRCAAQTWQAQVAAVK